MAHTLRELARLVGGAVSGDGDLRIHGAAILRDARDGQITLADRPQLADALAASQASAVVVGVDFRPSGLPSIAVDDVHEAFARIVACFRPPRPRRAVGISPRADVSPTARLGRNVDVHPGAVVGDDVEIGDGSVIHSCAVVMAGCRLGREVTVFPGAVLYENTVLGDRVVVHGGAILGAYGFGYEKVDGRHQLCAQLGNVEVGDDVEIGAGATIDRGTYGPTVIGEGTKLDDQVMIGHNCRIGRHNLLCSQVGIAGSSTTGDYVVMAGQVGIGDHLRIGDDVQIGAQAGVMDDIAGRQTMLGSPAIPLRDQMVIIAALSKLPELRKQVRSLQRTIEELRAERNAFTRRLERDQPDAA
jgi:UDP-3-O-[3-hydroxymyristoyl] glucosamine N-acyltransferase